MPAFVPEISLWQVVSLLAEENFQLDAHRLILIGGDGASWIKQGAHRLLPPGHLSALPLSLKSAS